MNSYTEMHGRNILFFLISGFICFLALSQKAHCQNQSWLTPTYLDTIKNPVLREGPEMEEAKKIYNSTCWSCHGLEGKGDGPASLQLNPKPADHTSKNVLRQSDGALFYKISVGKGDMQPYSKLLTVKQRWALVNYIRSLSSDAHEIK